MKSIGFLLAMLLAAADVPPLDWGDLKVDRAGEYQTVMQPKEGLSRQVRLKVFQVLGPKEMLVSIDLLDFRIGAPRSSDVKWSEMGLVRVDTKGLVDDQLWEPEGRCFRVTGTSTYETAAGGTSTVFVLEEVARDKLAEVVDEQQWPARWTANKRTWKRSKDAAIEAVYDGFETGHVWLKREDRSRMKVALKDLDAASRRAALRLAREAGAIK